MKRKIQVKERQPQFCVVTGITFTQVDAWFGNTMRDLKMDLIYPKDAGKNRMTIFSGSLLAERERSWD